MDRKVDFMFLLIGNGAVCFDNDDLCEEVSNPLMSNFPIYIEEE